MERFFFTSFIPNILRLLDWYPLIEGTRHKLFWPFQYIHVTEGMDIFPGRMSCTPVIALISCCLLSCWLIQPWLLYQKKMLVVGMVLVGAFSLNLIKLKPHVRHLYWHDHTNPSSCTALKADHSQTDSPEVVSLVLCHLNNYKHYKYS